MSKIAKKPIIIPQGITLKLEGGFIIAKGPKGETKIKILPYIQINIDGDKISVKPENSERQAMANWGSMAAFINNVIQGVKEGFVKTLIIEGVGYRANLEGKKIILSLGFVNPVNYELPEGVNAEIEKSTIIKLSGISKDAVGQAAAKIRSFKKPEPYKGKGIHYDNEIIRRKAGKKVAGATGAAA
ncbi:50S ribosomal protein L6 [Patescibacteria group bacterium]|nr:50S ribosomal protein L6 [Patescibacteria group bacterium]MCL5733483.1 50S ribosomal protein L6 [Patescibacteria group bacterium]